MTTQSHLINAEQLSAGYKPFIVEGEVTGELSEVPGREDVRTGVFRVLEGEYPDRIPVPYFFETDEYIWVIEGEVHVSSADGDEVVLRAGDAAFFPQGSESTWTFHAPFRKFSVEIQGAGA
ncbi:cupin domain-containing protein [Paenarthrobacter sp. NyZ202]|uniref:cupin domain-containing protein n=1 Tax=Paenarthrobacter sp. NyZ202 TaxID=3402689 RepID=UPI003CF52503